MSALRNPAGVLQLAHCAELAANDVHVWRVSVERCRDRLPELRALLSPDERLRADRFALAKPRSQFTVTRASLRLILGGYLREQAGMLRFVYGAYGKPALADHERLCFNVAHSEDTVLIAVAPGFEIGVDVEYCRANVDTDELGPVCLDADEIARMRTLEPAARRRAFFENWTSKEALSKAVGRGLTVPLDAIHIGEGSERVFEMAWHSGDGVDRWFCHRVDVGPEYSAALATPSVDNRLRHFGVES